MAEEQTGDKPGPPAGVQRPGIPGAGNLLDPEVRAEVREKVQAAMPHPPGHAAQPDHAAQPTAPPAAPSGDAAADAPSPVQHRAGPFPHGDVDLSGFAANVPAGPVRPRRGRIRSYYFLKPAADATPEESPPPATQPSPGPKPG